MKSETEENPSLRQRFGEKVAASIRKQRAEERSEAKYKAAFRKAFPRGKGRKADRGKIILVAGTDGKLAKAGQRVPASHRGKVFAFYVARTGKVTPYKEKVREPGKRAKSKTKVPVPYSPRTMKPSDFPTQAARKQAVRLLAAKGARLVEPVVVTARKRNVGWHEDVVEGAARAMAKLTRRATGGSGVGDLPLVVEAKLTVEMPDGRRRDVVVEEKFGQRREQGRKAAGFYRGFLSKQMYARIGDSLQSLGVVSMGSAMRVSKAPENRGKPPGRWRWRGGPWHKRDLYKAGKVARISKVVVQPYLVQVTSVPQEAKP